MSKIKFSLSILIACVSLAAMTVFAASGGIDANNRHAWTENAGWLDFGTTQGNVQVGDSALTGYAWGDKIGWVSLNCSNTSSCATVDYKVINDGNGNLTGYAWGENCGWINFAPTGGGVSIDSDGYFSGYAWGDKIGWVVFNCATTNSCATVDYKVETDWRAESGGDSIVSHHSVGGQYAVRQQDLPQNSNDIDTVAKDQGLVGKVIDIIKSPFAGLLGAKPQANPQGTPSEAAPENGPENANPAESEETEIAVPILETPPTADETAQNESKFSFLPESLLNFAKKFPEFFETLKQTGVDALANLQKLKNITFNFSGLAQKMGLNEQTGQTGQELLAQASNEEKEKIPSEIIFARLGSIIDLPVAVAVDQETNAAQEIKTIAAKPLELAIKPEFPARAVKGIILLKQSAKTGMLREFFAPTALAQNEVAEFNYQDNDGDGIFLAQINAPAVAGQYELTTRIEYQDETLPQKELGATLLIDPEGYIFEKTNGKETRIPNASVSLFWENPQTQKFELWPAANYQQVNPQTTDNRGTYAFLVPEGNYYLQVETPDYPMYKGKTFAVTVGAGVHQNIGLKKEFSWRDLFSWNWLMFSGLIAVAVLLAVNFWRDRKRNREI